MPVFHRTIVRAIGRFASERRRMRNQARTERLINTLPREIRKDIGWPDTYPGRSGREA